MDLANPSALDQPGAELLKQLLTQLDAKLVRRRSGRIHELNDIRLPEFN